MHSLVSIFEFIRKKKKFHQNMLVQHLGITRDKFIHIRGRELIPPGLIEPWATWLEIPSDKVQGYLYLHQYEQRYRVYRMIPECPLRKEIADLIYFGNDERCNKDALAKVLSAIGTFVIPMIHTPLPQISEALTDLRSIPVS